jgi:NAD(P)-dependent dehydrogenase (short-subunit alcohol dehydrogenase family)
VILCASAGTQKAFPRFGVRGQQSRLVGFCEDMGLELVGKKIRVNSISPGFNRYAFVRQGRPDGGAETGGVQAYTAKVLMDRFALPGEIASSVTFLASDDSST